MPFPPQPLSYLPSHGYRSNLTRILVPRRNELFPITTARRASSLVWNVTRAKPLHSPVSRSEKTSHCVMVPAGWRWFLRSAGLVVAGRFWMKMELRVWGVSFG